MSKIAISGKANSGKNTAAELFIKNFNGGAIFAFADPIKEMIMKMYPGADRQDLWGPSNRRMNVIPGATDSFGKPLTYRQLLLDIGKLGRLYNEDTWVQATIYAMNKFSSDGNMAVVSDVRFRNELQALREADFYIIRIIRPDNSVKVNDVSETDLDGIDDSFYDHILLNDSGVNELEQKILAINISS